MKLNKNVREFNVRCCLKLYFNEYQYTDLLLKNKSNFASYWQAQISCYEFVQENKNIY